MYTVIDERRPLVGCTAEKSVELLEILVGRQESLPDGCAIRNSEILKRSKATAEQFLFLPIA
jgi:hypothetical protein